ncbi:MAG: response regulator [Bdellovibrionales bacterium]|nr:response regulator [Bdellovibrionales bacterium]
MSQQDEAGGRSLVPAKSHRSGFGEVAQTAGSAGEESLAHLRALLDLPECPDDFFIRAVEAAATMPGVAAAALFLVPDNNLGGRDIALVHAVGPVEVPPPQTARTKSGSLKALDLDQEQEILSQPYEYLRITGMKRTVGWLGVALRQELARDTRHVLEEVAFLSGIAFERPRLLAQVKHYSDKLEVLNELNKLVAGGVTIERIMRTLAREAAFRFSADCSLSFLLPEEAESLQVRGVYGCPPKSMPTEVPLADNQLGRSLKLGGIMSVPDLSLQGDNGLQFLADQGFLCVHWASIEMRGELLGAVLIGFRDPRVLTELEGDMLEEFARGAAVAIANARNQETLTKYTEKLEELVQERTADLAVQTARADEANQAKSRFVANMSHELRTPLTAIVGYSSVIAEKVFGEINEQQEEALRAICRAADHLKELINDVLDVAKVEAGKEDAQPTEVELYGLLEQIFKLMMQTALGKGVKLIPLKRPTEGAEIKGWIDARHIRQILINLMSNAVKYTPTGGEVSLTLEVLGDKAKITVTDTGVGIAQCEQSRVFEHYARTDDEYSRSQVGTGIGLSLTKRLIEMNGGKIGLESEKGKGSDFWILVPLAAASATLEQQADYANRSEGLRSSARLDGLNVLVVDDNHLTTQVLQTIIAASGGNVYVAHSVGEAKEIATTTSLDTALIDLAMPGENGLVLLDYFRNQCEEPLATMPLIVVSACVFDSDKQEALKHGAATFVAKPFVPAEIVSTIRELTTSSVIGTH